MSQNNKENNAGCAAVIVMAVITVIACLIGLSNCHNHRVEGGFAQYITTNPWFDKKEFVDVQVGPNSTGFRWRLKSYKVSVTPYTFTETFDTDSGAILGRDKLPISCRGAIVFRLNPARIKDFMENYGGIAQCMGSNDDDNADEIVSFAYKNFIQQPLRTAIRSELSKYDSLDASANLSTISNNVLAEIRERLAETPFMVDSVVVGETNPPKEVIESVIKKVQANQENERMAIQQEIAQKSIEIERAAGEAEGAKRLEIARQEAAAEIARGEAAARVKVMQGEADAAATLARARAEAEGTALLESAIGERVLTLRVSQNVLNNSKIVLPAGDGQSGMGILGLLNLDKDGQTPAPTPVPVPAQ